MNIRVSVACALNGPPIQTLHQRFVAGTPGRFKEDAVAGTIVERIGTNAVGNGEYHVAVGQMAALP
jgi:hypothetical protein